jgi:putative transposase
MGSNGSVALKCKTFALRSLRSANRPDKVRGSTRLIQSPAPTSGWQSETRPGGPDTKRRPSPVGLGIQSRRIIRAPEARLQTLSCAKPPSQMSHSYSNNYVHAVFSTKDRQNLIPPEFEKRLYSLITAVAREHKVPLLAAGGMPDHSHLLFLLPATISLASAINTFKANSSRFMHERGLAFQWQNGYGPSV